MSFGFLRYVGLFGLVLARFIPPLQPVDLLPPFDYAPASDWWHPLQYSSISKSYGYDMLRVKTGHHEDYMSRQSMHQEDL